MRSEGGWYEEDCQWFLVAVVHPIGFQRVAKIEGKDDRTEYEYAMETMNGRTRCADRILQFCEAGPNAAGCFYSFTAPVSDDT
jgi:hypothetical protein